MPTEPSGNTIFCDDIRQEVGNKISLMGIFHGDMLINSPLPATLPKFGLYITYSEPMTEPPINMKLMVYVPGDPEDKPTFTMPIEWPEEAFKEVPSDKARALKMQFVLTPILFKEPGRIRVRMDRKGTIVKLGSLQILQGTTPSQ